MPGKRITDQQMRLYIANCKDKTQSTSAAKACFSELSTRRIEYVQRQLGSAKPRSYRTQKDPIESIWDSVVILLLEDSGIITTSIFSTIRVRSIPNIFTHLS